METTPIMMKTTGTALPNRYPGTFPFADTELDRIRFRGREEEVRTLFHQLLSAGLLVVVSTNCRRFSGSELRTRRRNRQFASYGGEMS